MEVVLTSESTPGQDICTIMSHNDNTNSATAQRRQATAGVAAGVGPRRNHRGWRHLKVGAGRSWAWEPSWVEPTEFLMLWKNPSAFSVEKNMGGPKMKVWFIGFVACVRKKNRINKKTGSATEMCHSKENQWVLKGHPLLIQNLAIPKNDHFAKWVDSGFFNSLKKDRIIPPLVGILFNGLKESPTKKIGSPSLTTMKLLNPGWPKWRFALPHWENYHPYLDISPVDGFFNPTNLHVAKKNCK